MNKRTLPLIAATALAAAAIGTIVTAVPSDAVSNTEPYGGCKELVQDYPAYVHTDGAADCRDLGWIVRPRILVAPTGHILVNTLPRCERTVQRAHCFVPRSRATGGRAYIVDTVGPNIAVTTMIAPPRGA